MSVTAMVPCSVLWVYEGVFVLDVHVVLVSDGIAGWPPLMFRRDEKRLVVVRHAFSI